MGYSYSTLRHDTLGKPLDSSLYELPIDSLPRRTGHGIVLGQVAVETPMRGTFGAEPKIETNERVVHGVFGEQVGRRGRAAAAENLKQRKLGGALLGRQNRVLAPGAHDLGTRRRESLDLLALVGRLLDETQVLHLGGGCLLVVLVLSVGGRIVGYCTLCPEPSHARTVPRCEHG